MIFSCFSDSGSSKLTVMPGHYIPVPPNLGGPQRMTSAQTQPHTTRDMPTHAKIPSDASSDIKFEQLLNEVKQRQTMSPDTGTPGTQSPGTQSPGTESPGLLSPDLQSPDEKEENKTLDEPGQAAITNNNSDDMFKPVSGDKFFETAAGSSSGGNAEVEVGSEAAEEAAGGGTYRWQHQAAAAQPTVGLLDEDELLNASDHETNSVNDQDDIEARTNVLQTTTSTFKLRKPVDNSLDVSDNGPIMGHTSSSNPPKSHNVASTNS